MQRFIDWLEDRTGIRSLVHSALYEHIPGGARWRYVWGSTLVFVFFVQLVTGLFLWMYYSPSAQTAWESVYYIEHQVAGGWLLRGVHHFAAQAMVVLLVLHVLQVVIDGAYKAPREVNFWLGLVLLLLVMGLALTGYLLPWDQKGYWATQVATKIVSSAPLVGDQLQVLLLGGTEYGHQTLTRFFALHAGLLPALLVAVLVLHLALFRRHEITPKLPLRRPTATFWPDQVLKDGIACLAVLAAIVTVAWYVRADLTAPANPAEPYDAARPEWYFLFLFQFLKYFHGERGIQIGAIYIPTVILLFLFLMPLFGRVRVGHWLNLAVLLMLVAGAAWLTYDALEEDYGANWTNAELAEQMEQNPRSFLLQDQEAQVEEAIRNSLQQQAEESPYHGKPPLDQWVTYFEEHPEEKPPEFDERVALWTAFQKSKSHIAAVAAAHAEAERARELAQQGIRPSGALTLLANDARTQGPRLFRRHCASCHSHEATDQAGGSPADRIPADEQLASNLYHFASREWLRGLLDPDRITSPHYFGNTPFSQGEMVQFVQDEIGGLRSDMEGDELIDFDREVEDVVIALSSDARLPLQQASDAEDVERIRRGREAMIDAFSCISCHKFQAEGDLGMAPDLTNYGSREWLVDFLGDPGHDRFYRDQNAMPAFHETPENPQSNKLTRRELVLIADWLRRDWYRPTVNATDE